MTKEVPGYGPITAEWAIIGEAPGYWEDEAGKPFVGRSGKLLRETLVRVGLDPNEAYITNVVKQRPPNNATPTAAQVREALPALAAELRELPNLRVILLVGATPLRAMTGLTGITQHRGTVKALRAEMEEFGALNLFATLHPAAILRNSNNQHSWRQDLAAFSQLVRPPKQTSKVIICEGVTPAFKAAIRDVGAIDVETTLGDPYNEEVPLVSVAVTYDGETAFVFRGEQLNEVAPYLTPTRWIMHNGYFDRHFLLLKGVDLTLAHDTMAMAYLLNPDERKSLEVLSSVWLGLPPYKGVDYEHILEEPFEKVAAMNGEDTLRTFNLYRPLADTLNKRPQLSRLYQWLLLPAVNALVSVTRNGVPVDRERFEVLHGLLREKHTELEESLQVQTEKDFNPRSPQQVGKWLYEHWKLPILETTESGAPSTSADVLRELIHHASGFSEKFLASLMQYRVVAKQLGYTAKWETLIDNSGRMHPKYKPLHVVTGRLSSELPNIQQVPRQAEFRCIFGGVPGYRWVKADYAQLELRIAAWVAQEKRLLQAFQDGADPHTLTAEMVLGSSAPSARQVGKTLNFGLLYGAGANTLQSVALNDYGIKMSKAKAWAYRDAFFQNYPMFLEWHNLIRASVCRSGYSSSVLGRTRYLPDAFLPDEEGAKHKAMREAINHPVQSLASDIVLHSLVCIDKEIGGNSWDAQVVAEVHDEIDILVADKDLEAVCKKLTAIMEDTAWLKAYGVNLTVPLVAELTVGTHWGKDPE